MDGPIPLSIHPIGISFAFGVGNSHFCPDLACPGNGFVAGFRRIKARCARLCLGHCCLLNGRARFFAGFGLADGNFVADFERLRQAGRPVAIRVHRDGLRAAIGGGHGNRGTWNPLAGDDIAVFFWGG